MKRILLTCVLGLSAAGAFGQVSAGQPGIAAKMAIKNGKVIPVYLQSLENGKLVFQVYKRPKNVPLADVAKVDRFEFLDSFDTAGVEQLFKQGDYRAVVDKMQSELKPSLDEYWQYMYVDNNFQNAFCMLMESYLKLGDTVEAGRAASILTQSSDPSIIMKGRTVSILIALRSGDVERAEKMLDKVGSEAGRLYLRACIERAKSQPLAALWHICELIEVHGNDMDWMPQAELLGADLYMDLSLTNSAINTARQVKNIYRGLNVAADAEARQAALVAEKERFEAEAARKAKEEAEHRAAVKARAAARAGIDNEESAVSGDGSADNDAVGSGSEGLNGKLEANFERNGTGQGPEESE